MRDAILAYDVSGILILIISGLYFIRTVPSRTSKYDLFIHIFTCGLLAGIFDISRVLMSSGALYGGMLWQLFNVFYLACIAFIVPLYLLLVISYTDTWHLIVNNKRRKVMSILPVVIGFIILAAGVFYPIIFQVSSDGVLIRKWGYYVINLLIIIYMLMTTSYITYLRRYIDTRYCRVLWTPLCIIAVALVIQLFYPNHHILVFSISVNCMFLILIGRRAEEALDVVTGMYSYRMFAQNMQMKMSTGKHMGLILINILNFEHIIRVVGYDDMVELMRPISNEIERILYSHKADNTCYYNGDGKFAIELSREHYENIHDIAAEIIKSINQNMRFEISDFEIRINACIVKCPTDVSDVDSLFMLISDLDIYPNTGKVLSATEITDTKEFVMKKEMTMILDRAINNHYFSVFYQPIYDVNEKRFASAEALIRLRDPKYGYISPGVFIPLAEKSGAIHAIGSFVIDEVCKFIGSPEFEELGLDYIEINLSVMQCLRSDLADEIISTAKKYNIDPKKLNLEITETASAYSQEKLHGNIRTLSQNGFTFSLDDFGTGYSNLMRITSLPLSIIKLDRTFVLLIEEKQGFSVIIKNLIHMLKNMGFKVLIEGIETAEMVDTFTNFGVDEIQGFYFSKPLTRTDYIRFIKEHITN